MLGRVPARLRGRLLVGALVAALLVCGGFSVVGPTATRLAGAPPAQQGGPTQPPAVLKLKVQERERASAALTPTTISTLRQQTERAQAQADRRARLIDQTLHLNIAYFNMLGCYHTDRDEHHHFMPAFHFASCGARMPRQYSWLKDHEITIAGVSEFQGKAWGVLHGINDGEWGMYPAYNPGHGLGQNPVVWRSNVWEQLSGEMLVIPYNHCKGCPGRGSSSLVLLKHRATGREVYVLATHHTVNAGARIRAAATSIDLAAIRRATQAGIPVIYMGDFNEGPRLFGSLTPAFDGMGIDQIWGTKSLTFTTGGYNASFRTSGLTDHGSGIAVAQVEVPPKG